MTHNKMYRYIEGYETSLDLACDVVDEVRELQYQLRYGKGYEDIIAQLNKINKLTKEIANHITNGEGKRIE